MPRIAIFCLAVLLPCSTLLAAQPASEFKALEFTCNIAFTHYGGIDQAGITKQARLTAPKHQPGGTVLVSQTDRYEFWLMSHGVQSIASLSFINNFQVAIQEKASGLFMHALSDTSHDGARPPQKARISLVDYHPDSTLEKGELLFECFSRP